MGFTHVPLDRYVLPIPKSVTFLEWLRTPDCIAWDHLLAHIAVLESGRSCFTPRPDWDEGWGRWISDGGPIDDGPGRRMNPARIGYLIPGTHSFSFPATERRIVRVFVDTPDAVIAERLTGAPQSPNIVNRVILARLGTNPDLIKRQAVLADFKMDGTAGRTDQLARFRDIAAQGLGVAESPYTDASSCPGGLA